MFLTLQAAVETNAQTLKGTIERLHADAQKKVIIVGHSKGGLDSAAALTLFYSDLKDKVAGLVFVQSPYGGTPLASDLLFPGPGSASTKAALSIVMDRMFQVRSWVGHVPQPSVERVARVE